MSVCLHPTLFSAATPGPPAPQCPPFAMPTHLVDFYEIRYEAEPPVLWGRSLRSLSGVEFTESCELLLRAAQRHHCRFWIIDGRANVGPRPSDIYAWMEEDFLPRLREALGRLPRIAFLVDPAAGPQARARSFVPPPDADVTLPFQLGWFGEDRAALAWLYQCRD